MANTQINITSNGTTTLATYDKYCDRNIDVNVNVVNYLPANTFTNYYNVAYVHLKQIANANNADGATISSNSLCNYIEIPYHHVKNEPFVLRVRGLSFPSRGHNSISTFDSDGTTKMWHGNYNDISSTAPIKSRYVDEYGDMVFEFNTAATLCTTEWYYIRFNFQYIGYNTSPSTALEGPIITINEPIGNGGHPG